MKQNAAARFFLFRNCLLVLAAGLFLGAARFLPAAEITVPRLEMASRGTAEDGEFELSSVISADIALTGGYKYAFLLGLSLEAADIAKAFAFRNFAAAPVTVPPTEGDYNDLVDRINNQAFIGFRVAKATARDIFGLPLELSYFIGEGDNFAAGDEFSSRFGLSPIGTDFKGFFYFPEGIGGVFSRRYNGLHGARGTGFQLGLTKWENTVPMLYLYQDFALVPGTAEEHHYSGDLRVLFHRNRLQLETFGGISVNADLESSLRGGLMFHLAGNGVEFFSQAGVPGWTPGRKFGIDNIFFLIEPRLRFSALNVFVTFFYHPSEYLHYPTNERGRADLNIKFQFGKEDSGLAGGIETGAELMVYDPDYFMFNIAPFGSFISNGLRWDAKIRIKPQNYDVPAEMLDFFIGVRTAF